MRLLFTAFAALRTYEDPTDDIRADSELRAALSDVKSKIQDSARLFDTDFKPKLQEIMDAESEKIAKMTKGARKDEAADKETVEALAPKDEADATSFLELDDSVAMEQQRNIDGKMEESIEKFHELNSRLKQFASQTKAEYLRDFAPKAASSLLQTLDSSAPDDGFAKVEAKLKALQEKIKADAAKFEQEAKSAPSSFAQTAENPAAGLDKIEQSLKALRDKIKSDTARMEGDAGGKLADLTSFVEISGKSAGAEAQAHPRHDAKKAPPFTPDEQQDEDDIAALERKLKKRELRYEQRAKEAAKMLKELKPAAALRTH